MDKASADNFHSRAVSILKVVLPLVALALLSTLFLFSHKINPTDAIPYASVDVEDRLRDPKMTDAGFSGMTADGSAIAISAAEAKPTAAGGSLQTVFGTLTTQMGTKTEVSSTAVHLDSTRNLIELSQGATLHSSSGYVVTAEGLGIATDKTLVESRGAVTAVGPLGQLSADTMRFSRDGLEGPYLLVFKGTVRLIYQPKK